MCTVIIIGKKGCLDSYISILTKILNTSSERGYIQNQLKLGEVTPACKKKEQLKLNRKS